MDYDTRLIKEIEKHAELYDQAHRDFKNKDAKKKVWAAITYNLRRQVDAHAVKTVKMRWKSLRDSYVKETRHKMAISSGQDLRPRKNWRYSSAMSFLAPHLAISFPVSPVKDISDESEDVHDDGTLPQYFLNIHPSHENHDDGHFLGALLDLSKNQIKTDLDHSKGHLDLSRNHQDVSKHQNIVEPTENEIDSFFRGLSDTVKKLNPVNQIRIQRDIVNMVLDVKLRELQEK
ncbi:unnamed protein product [Phaedon cochleariae]|uniref:MADF domain-containing protein n=1 Tax=Phaedon cochleariae TaxID=80249 RepID=A0A9N9SHA1_PHACE|nr:unnamed protein product [Phaedon cochleariae]